MSSDSILIRCFLNIVYQFLLIFPTLLIFQIISIWACLSLLHAAFPNPYLSSFVLISLLTRGTCFVTISSESPHTYSLNTHTTLAFDEGVVTDPRQDQWLYGVGMGAQQNASREQKAVCLSAGLSFISTTVIHLS